MLDFIGDVIGSVLDANAAQKANKAMKQNAALDRQMQLDFAQQGIQWKVADAKRAGVHPLAALGVMPSSYSPVGLHLDSGGGFGDVFRSLGAMGQNLTRPRLAGQTPKERSAEVARGASQLGFQEKAANALTLENMQLQNDLLRSNIARANQAQVGPALPTENFPPGSVDRMPDRVSVGDVGAPERSPGVTTDYAFARTASGGYALVPGQDVKQRIEDMPLEWTWMFRNGLMPDRSIYAELERRDPAGPGMVWQYDTLRGEFRRVRRDSPGRSAWEFFMRPDLYQQRR